LQIEVRKPIDASNAKIFSVVSEIEQWPEIMRSVRSVHPLTPPPFGPGSRFQQLRVMLRHSVYHDVEILVFDRPHRLLLSATSADLDYQLDHLIESVFGAGPRLTMIFRSQPRTLLHDRSQPFLAPFMGITLRDELEQDLGDLAAAVER
jgi:hypothetical protein